MTEAPEATDPVPTYTGHRDRLRQRFLTAGAAALADYEILELLLFAAIPRRDTKPLAKQLIATFGSLGAVLAATPTQLAQRGGLSDISVALLKVVQAAAERLLKEQVTDRPVLGSWQALLDYLGVAMKFGGTEQVRVLYLDRKNALLADDATAQGTVDQAPVYPREVARRALELGASALILVHNHPSGDPTPSRADIEMTKAVARALETVGVTLHDHVIVGRKGHSSFRSLGLL
ncbi:DNA repair protein RadC [Inquilinus sp. NPDC058860]|uniref:RadC family protein n=1 Tax=Inquilinus sp. NPDC058860 TaxID=3346652 RepID=UPI0036A3D844